MQRRALKNARFANNYAKSFDDYRKRLDELAREAFQNLVRGQQPPKQLFKMLANAAQDLNYALEGLGGAEPVKIIRGPAAGLCGAIKRVAPSSTVRSSPAMPPEYPTSGPCSYAQRSVAHSARSGP